MSSAFRRTLAARPDLDQQRTLAKELLAAFRRAEPDAVARVRTQLPDKARITLTDAQFVLAREYGFPGWAALKAHIEKIGAEQVPPLERFKRAVRDRDATAVRRVLERHADMRASINEPLFSFDSPALVAVSDDGDVELVNVLLEFGADPNRKSSWWAGGFHPLYAANGAVAERLLSAGAIPDACAAAHLDRLDLLTSLLRDDASRVHERGGDGQTPLHFARSRRVVDCLLENGADIDARDVDHRATAAQWMIGEEQPGSRPRLTLARYLAERGASVDIFLAAALDLADRAGAMVRNAPSLLSLRTGQGEYGEQPPSSFHIYLWTIGANLTPLQAAATFGSHDTLAEMIELASPEQRLLLACHQGRADEARSIVAAHPGIVERLDERDARALTDAAWAANTRAVELMLELGFDPSVPSRSGPAGGTALHCAAWEGSVDCVRAILAYERGRALVETRDSTYGGTPLGWCCHGSRNCGRRSANHVDVARLLLAAGARANSDMNACSDEMQAVIDEALREQ